MPVYFLSHLEVFLADVAEIYLVWAAGVHILVEQFGEAFLLRKIWQHRPHVELSLLRSRTQELQLLLDFEVTIGAYQHFFHLGCLDSARASLELRHLEANFPLSLGMQCWLA